MPWNPLGTVVIGQQTSYERKAVKAVMQKMIEDMGGLSWTVPPGGSVALKVCLPAWSDSAENLRFGTHPEVVRALGELLLDAGAGTLYIVEALAEPGAFTAWGYQEIAQPLNATLVDLNSPLPAEDFIEVPVVSAALVYESFKVNRIQPLRLHYARTLQIWAASLESRRDDAIAIQSEEVYDRYMKYLTGCAELFTEGYTDVCQFTLAK